MPRRLVLILALVLLAGGCGKSKSGNSPSGGGTNAGHGGSNEFSIKAFQGKSPVLIVSFTTRDPKPHLKFQAEWQQASADVQKHGVILIDIRADSNSPSATASNGQTISAQTVQDLIDAYGSYGSYRTTLIGKDGKVKLVQKSAPKLPEIFQALESQ